MNYYFTHVWPELKNVTSTILPTIPITNEGQSGQPLTFTKQKSPMLKGTVTLQIAFAFCSLACFDWMTQNNFGR